LQLRALFFDSFNFGKQYFLFSSPFLLHSRDFTDFFLNTIRDSVWLIRNIKLSAEGRVLNLELFLAFLEHFNLILKLLVV